MKFALLLILLLFIVDCKKLRNNLKKKGCNERDAKCGWFRAKCCKPYECVAAFGMFGYCAWKQYFKSK